MAIVPTTLTTSPVSGAASDLLKIVRMNEEIKRVVGIAFRINVMALNAIFLAKRAGAAALGFGVLSNELRGFSTDLRGSMQGLTGLIHACVGEVSRNLQDQRSVRLLQGAARLSVQEGLEEVLGRRRLQADAQAGRLALLRRRLRSSLDDASQQVELGGMLAKSAKIEAAYGQGFAVSLAQVSGEFSAVVEEIRLSLELLRKSPFLTGREERGQ